MDYLDADAFILLAQKLYKLPVLQSSTHADLSTLIATTKLTHHSLLHVLYYLQLLVTHKTSLYPSNALGFHTSSREKLLPAPPRRTSTDLFELLVVLMMISNKTNDDSSYTMKTWENLTPLTIPVLRQRELVVLKKINYNVFLKEVDHYRWNNQLYLIALKSSILKAKYTLPPALTTPVCQVSTPLISLSPLDAFPLTPRSPSLELSNKRRIPEPFEPEPYKKARCTPQPMVIGYMMPYLPLQPQQQLLTPIRGNDVASEHPQDCTCCALTRMTDVYHSTMRGVKL